MRPKLTGSLFTHELFGSEPGVQVTGKGLVLLCRHLTFLPQHNPQIIWLPAAAQRCLLLKSKCGFFSFPHCPVCFSKVHHHSTGQLTSTHWARRLGDQPPQRSKTRLLLGELDCGCEGLVSIPDNTTKQLNQVSSSALPKQFLYAKMSHATYSVGIPEDQVRSSQVCMCEPVLVGCMHE